MIAKENRSPFSKPCQSDEAFITSILPYGESDCVVRMLLRKSGRAVGFFKRGLAVKKAGKIQAPSLSQVDLLWPREGELLRIVKSDASAINFVLVKSLKSFAYAAYLAELIEKLLPEQEPAPEIFDMVVDTFNYFSGADPDPAVLRSFELKLLDFCGYLPEMPASDEESRGIVAYDPHSSHFLAKANDLSLPFSYDAIVLAKSMLIAKVGAVHYKNMAELLMIGRIFLSRLRHLGISDLKSVAFLKQLPKNL